MVAHVADHPGGALAPRHRAERAQIGKGVEVGVAGPPPGQIDVHDIPDVIPAERGVAEREPGVLRAVKKRARRDALAAHDALVVGPAHLDPAQLVGGDALLEVVQGRSGLRLHGHVRASFGRGSGERIARLPEAANPQPWVGRPSMVTTAS